MPTSELRRSWLDLAPGGHAMPINELRQSCLPLTLDGHVYWPQAIMPYLWPQTVMSCHLWPQSVISCLPLSSGGHVCLSLTLVGHLMPTFELRLSCMPISDLSCLWASVNLTRINAKRWKKTVLLTFIFRNCFHFFYKQLLWPLWWCWSMHMISNRKHGKIANSINHKIVL